MNKNFVTMDNPILRTPSEEVDFNDRTLEDKLKENIGRGIGLSACQIGINKRACLCVIDNTYEIMYNPIIIDKSEETTTVVEKCLSFPNIHCWVKRNNEITVKYFNREWKEITRHLTGLNSVVVQHEIDHLNGIRMLDKAIKKAFHRG